MDKTERKYPLITNAKLTLTNKCQLRCTYCFEEQDIKEMSYQVAKDSVDWLAVNAKEMKVEPRITLFGGEPLLRYEDIIKPLVLYIREAYGVYYHIDLTTNGLLLDEEKLKFLKENRVNFMLSIDGSEQSHNACRVYHDGKGSYKDLEKNIPKILEYYPLTRARMTVSAGNIPYLFEAITDLEAKGFQDMHILPNVFEEWSDEVLVTAREQMAMYKDYIIKRFEEDEIPLVFQILKQMFCKIVILQHEIEHNRYREFSQARPCNRCGIGCTGVGSVDTEGNVFSCQHASVDTSDANPMFLGTIYSEWSEERIDRLLEMNSSTPLFSSELNCSECPLNRICTGGCVPNNYGKYGNFNQVPKVYCEWTKIVYETALSIIQCFDKTQTNELFKDWFYGAVTGGVTLVG